MKKKTLALALLLASSSAFAAPGAGPNAAGRPAGLNLLSNLGNSSLAALPRPAQTSRLAAVRANRLASGAASNNPAIALANSESRSLPGLEALGDRFNRNGDRPRSLVREGSADGDTSFDFDSSTSTNSDGSTSRTVTTSFQREGDGKRTTRSLVNNEATRTVETANNTSLDTSLTVNRPARSDRSPEASNGRGLRLGTVELNTDYSNDSSRKVTVEGTKSSDMERNTSSSTDYSGTFDSSRPFDGKPLNVEYRTERTRANGETVVRTGDTAALTPIARGRLRENVRDNAEQRQDNRQERRDARQDARAERVEERRDNN